MERSGEGELVKLADGMWQGREVYLVGSGPSAAGWRAPPGELVVAAGRAGLVLDPPPSLWVSLDSVFWRKVGTVARPGCARVWIDTGDLRPEVEVVLPCAAPRSAGTPGNVLAWGRSLAEGVGGGGNSGYSALNLADVLGASRVYLVGFDGPEPPVLERWLAAWSFALEAARPDVVVVGESRLPRGRTSWSSS